MAEPARIATANTLFSNTNSTSRVYASPVNSIRVARPGSGTRPTYDRVEYVTIFNPQTRTSAIYRQEFNLLGQRQPLDATKKIATRQSDGTYQPSQYARDNLPANVVNAIANDENVQTGLNTSLEYTVRDSIRQINGQPATPAQVASALGTTNPDAATPANPGNPADSGGGGGDGSGQGTLSTTEIEGQGSNFAKKSNFSGGDLIYPLRSSDTLPQDYICFSSKIYAPATYNESNFGFNSGTNSPTGDGTKVYLPIQGSIADSNGVGWNEETINALQIVGMEIATETMEKGVSSGINALINNINKVSAQGPDVKSSIVALAAEQAVGANILPRVSRAVFNPNTELLFQGPQLRGFSFTFKLTPRSADESAVVKDIIKFFKKNMAAKTTESQIFLKAPNVFGISYKQFGKSKSHQGINLIKDCALQSFNVDYTPDGTYMAYKDGAMFSYVLTMQFMELTPIYSKDYDSGEGASHPIGF